MRIKSLQGSTKHRKGRKLKTKPIELLAPAGNFEKLEIAIHYGADAVYLSGKDFSLRNFSGNFTEAELEQAVALAHKHDVDVYVACNIYSRDHEHAAVLDFLTFLKQLRPDGLISMTSLKLKTSAQYYGMNEYFSLCWMPIAQPSHIGRSNPWIIHTISPLFLKSILM